MLIDYIVLIFYIQLILLIYIGYTYLLKNNEEVKPQSNVVFKPGKNINIDRIDDEVYISTTVDTYEDIKQMFKGSASCKVSYDDDQKQFSVDTELNAMVDCFQDMFVGGEHLAISHENSKLIFDTKPLTDVEFENHLEKVLVAGENIQLVPKLDKLTIQVPTSNITSHFVAGENVTLNTTDSHQLAISTSTDTIKKIVQSTLIPGDNIDMEIVSEGVKLSLPTAKIHSIVSNYLKAGDAIKIKSTPDTLTISAYIDSDQLQALLVPGNDMIISREDEKLIFNYHPNIPAIVDMLSQIIRGGNNIAITTEGAYVVINDTNKDVKSQLQGWLRAGKYITIAPTEDALIISADPGQIYETIKETLTSSDNSINITADDANMTVDITSTHISEKTIVEKLLKIVTGSQGVRVDKIDDKLNISFDMNSIKDYLNLNLVAGKGVVLENVDDKITISSNLDKTMLVDKLHECLVGFDNVTITKVDDTLKIGGLDSLTFLNQLQSLLQAGENINLTKTGGHIVISSKPDLTSLFVSDANITIDILKDKIKFGLNANAISNQVTIAFADQFNKKLKAALSASDYFTSAIDESTSSIMVGINPAPFNNLVQSYLSMQNIHPITARDGLTMSNIGNNITLGLDASAVSNSIATYLDTHNITGITAGAGITTQINQATQMTTLSIDTQVLTNLMKAFMRDNNIKSISVGTGLSSSTSNDITTISLDLYTQLKNILSRGNLVNVVFREKSKRIAFRYDLLSNDLNLGNTIDMLT